MSVLPLSVAILLKGCLNFVVSKKEKLEIRGIHINSLSKSFRGNATNIKYQISTSFLKAFKQLVFLHGLTIQMTLGIEF